MSKTKNAKEKKPVKNESTDLELPFEKDYFKVKENPPRFISRSEFKNKVSLNIREYYEKDGKILPGKKGINLSKEEFDLLLEHLEEIKEWFATESKKSSSSKQEDEDEE